MKLKPVNSSNIVAIGHDPATETLHVQFNSGKTYAYSHVDADAHSALINADSIGSHFAKNIRSKYPAKEV